MGIRRGGDEIKPNVAYLGDLKQAGRVDWISYSMTTSIEVLCINNNSNGEWI